MSIYLYIYIGIVSLRASVLSPFRSSWTRTLLGGLWNVHNSYETCTTSMERAQLLWNVGNSYETCATSMIYISSQTLQKALNDTIPIYIYIHECRELGQSSCRTMMSRFSTLHKKRPSGLRRWGTSTCSRPGVGHQWTRRVTGAGRHSGHRLLRGLNISSQVNEKLKKRTSCRLM